MDGHVQTRGGKSITFSDWKIEDYGAFFQFTPRSPTTFNKITKAAKNLSINSAHWKKLIHGDLTVHTTKDRDVFYLIYPLTFFNEGNF